MSTALERAVKNATWITAASVVTTVFGVLFWATAAAVAGKAGLGAAAYEIAAANTAATLLNLGLMQYALRFVKTERGKALATALLAAVALGAVGAAALYLLGMRWAPVIAFATLLTAPSTGALIAVDAPRAYFASAAVASAAKVGLLAVLPPAAAFAAATATTALLATAYALWKVGLGRPGDWRTFFAAGVSNYMLNFSFFFATSLGVVAAGILGGVEQAGLLYLVATAAMALAAVSTAIATASIPVMVEGGTYLAERGARIAAGINTPIALAATGLSPLLMTLLGKQYAADYPALAAAAPAVVMLAAVSLATAVYNVERRWSSIALIGLAGTASTVAAVVLLAGLKPAGPGLAITLGLLPPFLLSLRTLPKKPFLASLATVLALGPAALHGGLPGSVAAVLASIAVMHFADVFKTGEYVALARTVLRR